MSVLRSLESKIAGLVEGTFSRAFRSEVRPVEIARRLAREMEEHKSFSVSRTYVPNEYVVYLSPRDRERFADYEQALTVELGEFGIQTRVAAPPEHPEHVEHPERGAPPRHPEPPERAAYADHARPEPESGRTMIQGASERIAEPLRERARANFETALLLVDGKRLVVGPGGATIGRSRQCDIVLSDPNVSRQHAEVRPRGGSWVLSDLGATNGVLLNGRRIDAPEVVRPGDRIELGSSTLIFELE